MFDELFFRSLVIVVIFSSKKVKLGLVDIQSWKWFIFAPFYGTSKIVFRHHIRLIGYGHWWTNFLRFVRLLLRFPFTLRCCNQFHFCPQHINFTCKINREITSSNTTKSFASLRPENWISLVELRKKPWHFFSIHVDYTQAQRVSCAFPLFFSTLGTCFSRIRMDSTSIRFTTKNAWNIRNYVSQVVIAKCRRWRANNT